MCVTKNHECISFRMDVCVESALLSSLIAWNSANRMAAMGERLLYDGICLGNCFSFGIELENRWLVEMCSLRCTEHAQAYWWWFLWFEFHLALAPFLAECEAFGHGFTSRIILTLCYRDFLLSRVKLIFDCITGLFPEFPLWACCWTDDTLVFCLMGCWNLFSDFHDWAAFWNPPPT